MLSPVILAFHLIIIISSLCFSSSNAFACHEPGKAEDCPSYRNTSKGAVSYHSLTDPTIQLTLMVVGVTACPAGPAPSPGYHTHWRELQLIIGVYTVSTVSLFLSPHLALSTRVCNLAWRDLPPFMALARQYCEKVQSACTYFGSYMH